MRTSIIIPTFDQQDTLEQAIESALAQTVECEVIVINDGSLDNTKFIAEEYADRVKVIHQSNRGLPSARNTGIMNATGEFILPLDSDDYLEPTCVERIEKVFDETDADIVSPSFKTFGVNNAEVMLNMRPGLDDFKSGNRIGYCSAFKRTDLLEVGGYSPRMVWGYEDLHLTISLLRKGKKIYTIPEFLWNYRTKQFSMITVAQAHHNELMAQIAKDNPGFYNDPMLTV